MKAAASLVLAAVPDEAGARAAEEATESLDGVAPALAVLFATPHYVGRTEALLTGVRSVVGAVPLIGATLSEPDRELLANGGVQLGRVIDEYRPEQRRGDFLVRRVVGADPDTGAIVVGDELEVGQTVQFHVRDPESADQDLREALEREVTTLAGRDAAGALLFTCNGRGSRLFSTPDHDAGLVAKLLGEVPAGGFSCAGEFGPMGGKNFLHGFTASVAIFR